MVARKKGERRDIESKKNPTKIIFLIKHIHTRPNKTAVAAVRSTYLMSTITVDSSIQSFNTED